MIASCASRTSGWRPSGNIAMTVYACTLLALFSLLWKMESIERRLKRLFELLEGEGDDGEE